MLTIITILNDYFLYFLSGHFATIEFLDEIKPPQANPSKNLRTINNAISASLFFKYIDKKNSPKRTKTKNRCNDSYKFTYPT